jgi:hypothetical protein
MDADRRRPVPIFADERRANYFDRVQIRSFCAQF